MFHNSLFSLTTLIVCTVFITSKMQSVHAIPTPIPPHLASEFATPDGHEASKDASEVSHLLPMTPPQNPVSEHSGEPSHNPTVPAVSQNTNPSAGQEYTENPTNQQQPSANPSAEPQPSQNPSAEESNPTQGTAGGNGGNTAEGSAEGSQATQPTRGVTGPAENSVESSQLSSLVSQAPTSAPANSSSCEDLHRNCKPNQCNTDQQRITCAKTCGACQLKDVCYDAYGSEQCQNYALFCGESENVNVACKATCGLCQPSSSTCTDQWDAETCGQSSIDCTDVQTQAFCANTCRVCDRVNACVDLASARDCADYKSNNLCDIYPTAQHVCKKTCGRC